MKALIGRLTILEKKGKRRLEEEDDFEEQDEEDVPFREEAQLDLEEERMARFVKSIRSGDAKGRLDLPLYAGKLDDEELIDQFSAMENCFEFENVEDKEKVRIAKTRLYFTLVGLYTSKEVEDSRPMITSWYTMMDKMKEFFLPSDYKVQIYKKMQSLRQ